MSKTSVRSKPSSTRHAQLTRRRRRHDEGKTHMKPFGFCCSVNHFDPLSKYDQKLPPYKSSLTSIRTANDSPVLKFYTRLTGQPLSPEPRRKAPEIKPLYTGDQKDRLDKDNRTDLSLDLQEVTGRYKLSEPIQCYLEDEISHVKDMVWGQRQKDYNEEIDRNTIVGRNKTKIRSDKMTNIKCPRWYQDFSIDQIESLMMLECVINKDYEEMVTARTQRTLAAIGVISTFFEIAPKVIRELQESSDRSAIDFLRETYKILTGNYFEVEGYKSFYDCNERIILSAIAFLTLPETVVELHKRLPPVIMPEFPPKPIPPVIPLRLKMPNPYEEELFTRPDWASYSNALQLWRERCRLIPIPRIILPEDCHFNNYRHSKDASESNEHKQSTSENVPERNQGRDSTNPNPPIEAKRKKEHPRVTLPLKPTAGAIRTDALDASETRQEVNKKKRKDEENERVRAGATKQQEESQDIEKPVEKSFSIPRLPDENKVFDFTINGLSKKPGPVEYKICGVMQPPQPNKKSWLGEKDAHYVISGAADEPPTCPVTYEMTGIANVTPSNSDDRFFAVLKLGDGSKKIYPSGRKNLSRAWQEWLQNADEEFKEVEREANKMIKDIEATMRLVFPGPTCDSCCSCRQTRKTHIKLRETKAPYFVIDTVAEDGNKNKYCLFRFTRKEILCFRYIVGSMAMHSPAPTPPESTVNLLEVIASEDRLTTNVVINGVTNEKGETQYFISGVRKDMIRVPGRIVEPPPPRPLRNVPACVCAVHEIFTKGITAETSHDNIPWTKEDGLCFGKKYRPGQSPAYSCKMYPGDKSCRRNPFLRDIQKMKRRLEKEKKKAEEKLHPSKEKQMYTVADFKPCGDEHGMAICGGPWGALNTLTPEELEEQERLRKEILRGPPCGTKPGRAVCEGPFGARIPSQKSKVTLDEMFMLEGGEELVGEEEELEEEEEEETEKEPPPEPVKEKVRHRDKECLMSPESIAARKTVVKKKVGKFIPDPNYHGYDDPWNIFRTAPTEKESETEYEKTLKLSTAQPQPARPVEIRLADDDGQDEKASAKKVISQHAQKSTDRVGQSLVKRTQSAKVTPKSPGIEKRREPARKPETKKSVQKILPRVESKVASSSAETPSDGIPGSIEKQKISGVSKESFKRPVDSPKAVAKGKVKNVPSRLKRDEESRTKGRGPSKLNENERARKTFGGRVSLTNKFKKSERSSFRSRRTFGQGSDNADGKFGLRSQQINKNSNFESGKRKRSGDRRTIAKGIQSHKPLKQKITRNLEESRSSKSEGDRVKSPGRKGISSFSATAKGTTKPSESDKSKTAKRDKKKETQAVLDIEPIDARKKEIETLKNMMMSSENYPYDVEPVTIPAAGRTSCQREYEDEEHTAAPEQLDDDEDTQLPSRGPCGWRTKSEQELPTKKNLIHLTDPDYPLETIPVRPGGKPCVCRANREKKKVLLYNIGGLLDKKKPDPEVAAKLFKKKKEDEEHVQVIEGVLYYTPPPSPRRSDEYVPEYDLYESPYDMCRDQRKDKNLKLLEQMSLGPKSLISGTMKDRIEPCGCNEFTDTHAMDHSVAIDENGNAIKDQTVEQFMASKPPKESWALALKDPGLADYFTRCRDSLPCWLKCMKFNKVGCSLQRRKLKLKRPVCECKYERKILERKEEKIKWKKRQQKLKSLKKQPFVNVLDTWRPVEKDTKLMISNVKRIPKEDEYIDDIKYCISGVAENYSMAPPQKVVGGVHISTPFATPEPSKHDLPRADALHRHWSPIHIPPGPLPKKEELLMKEKKRRQEALEQAVREIYKPVIPYDTHTGHSCKETCNDSEPESAIERKGEEESSFENEKTQAQYSNESPNRPKKQIGGKRLSVQEERTKLRKEVHPEVQKTSDLSSVKNQPETATQNTHKREKSIIKIEKNLKEDLQKIGKIENTGRKGTKELPQGQVLDLVSNEKSAALPSSEEDNEIPEDAEGDLTFIAKIELKKMAAEGFVFAMLPKAILMPQLQYWLMYRKGVVFSDMDKRNLVRNSIALWNMLDDIKGPKIKAPSLHMTKKQLGELTFDDAPKMKRKIAKKQKIFYSKVRKARVMYARSMWNTMEYGKFPSTSFKRAYFTYMPGKEADGHVFKPWNQSEVREMI